MAQWLYGCTQPNAWLTLDSNDNDLGIFVGYLCAAIRTTFPDACGQAIDLLNGSQMPPAHVVMAAFVNELDDYFERRQPLDADGESYPRLILALDDFHTITEPTIHQFVADLITYLPRCLHLAVTSRTDPPFPLAGMRARKEMSELRTGDLRFTMSEAASLLESTLGRPVKPETVALLEGVTEGWAVGLRLAGLTLRNTQDEEQFTQQFREIRSAMIVDYLVSEVLTQQPKPLREFLLATSILDRFSADLCDALFPRDEGNLQSSTVLQELNRANLFLLPLDQEGRWFRYHHLFRDLLLNTLERERGRADIETLHRRASLWFAANDLIDEALAHALAADDLELAANIVGSRRYALMNGTQWRRLDRYLHRFSPQFLAQQPELLMLKTWLLHHRGDFTQLPAALKSVETHLETRPLPMAAIRHLRGEISALRSLLAYYQTDPVRAITEAEFAIDNTPAELWIIRLLARLVMAGAYQMQGDLSRAQEIIFHSAHQEGIDTHPFKATTLMSACYIYWIAGDLVHLTQAAQRCIDLCDYPNSVEIAGYGHYHLGCAAYCQNDLAAAERHFALIVDRPYLSYGESFANAALGLALTYQAQNRPDAAREVGGSAIAFMMESGNTSLLSTMQASQAQIALLQGDLVTADQWASTFDSGPSLSPMPHLCRPHITLAKIWLAHDTSAGRQQAAALLEQLQEYAQLTHNTSVLIEVLALQALRYAMLDDESTALAQLQRSLTLARPGGFIRLFVDLGSSMATLLKRLDRDGVDPDYIGQILAAFPPAGCDGHASFVGDQAPAVTAPIEALTPRESDVLALLAKRLSNREIAETLVIAPGTVKTHTLNIYAKLDVHSRTQAVNKAEELGLLTPG